MIRRAQPWLGTLVEISVRDDARSGDERGDHIGAAINAAFAAIALVHRRMSFHAPDSDVSAINRLAIGDSVVVDAATAEVLRCAGMLEDVSAGIFNLACGQRLAAWGYLPQPAAAGQTAPALMLASTYAPHQPLPRAVIALDAHDRVSRCGAGWIDLGGIAKGYAVDRAVAALQAHSVANGCVNAGGDLRAFGQHGFTVSVRNPLDPTRVGRTLDVRNQALATSACYFSRRDIDGVAHSALLNGTDGLPIVVDTSVSVQAPSCMLADGLTKIVMATGDPRHALLAQFAATAFIL